MKNTTLIILIIACLVGGLFLYAKYDKVGVPDESEKPVAKVETTDYKSTSYVVGENELKLTNGVSEIAAAPGSATRIVTKYFGNDLHIDLNDDGREDVVFLLTQDPGGSGTFYYVVAALNTDNGYLGSAGYLLGDRIAPQSIDMSQNPNHKNVIVVNYFDHATDAPMAEKPKLAKSVWLKLDPATMQFGEVEQNFEGEADPSRMRLTMKTWKWQKADYADGKRLEPKDRDAFTIMFKDDHTFSVTTDCNSMSGTYKTDDEQDINLTLVASTLMACEGSQESEFKAILSDVDQYNFTTKGELVFVLKEGNGLVYFR